MDLAVRPAIKLLLSQNNNKGLPGAFNIDKFNRNSNKKEKEMQLNNELIKYKIGKDEVIKQ